MRMLYCKGPSYIVPNVTRQAYPICKRWTNELVVRIQMFSLKRNICCQTGPTYCWRDVAYDCHHDAHLYEIVDAIKSP